MEDLAARFALTLLAAAIGVALKLLLKLPTNAYISALIAVAIFNVAFDRAYFPADLKFYMRALTGFYVGSIIRREDLIYIRKLGKAPVLLVIGLLSANLIQALVLTGATHLNLYTALLSTAPGGAQDLALLAEDFGADQAKVAALQILRVAFSVSVMPMVINAVIRRRNGDPRGKGAAEEPGEKRNGVYTARQRVTSYATGIPVALLGAWLFTLIRFPAGSLVGSMLITICMNVAFPHRAPLHREARYAIQGFNGALIGVTIDRAEVQELARLWLPLILMLLMVLACNLLFGLLLERFTGMDLVTSMYASAAGGLSDMALISMDAGANPTQVAAMHMVRYVTVMSVFPSIFMLLLHGGFGL